MAYEKMASSNSPALVIYLIDLSASMTLPVQGMRRIDVVTKALQTAIETMVGRSTKGSRVMPRYHIAVYGYSDEVFDVLDGVRSITEVAAMSLPPLETFRLTRTADAFLAAEALLLDELDSLRDRPAPLVCHLTDGQYNGDDPEPVINRIRDISLPDGNVLVENIFISDEVLQFPPTDPRRWTGIMPETPLLSAYADKLRAMSSELPESYREMLLECGYNLAPGAKMMLPGTSAELVSLGFQMSHATRMGGDPY